MRAVATLIIILLVSLPSLFAGWPQLSPAWFAESRWGIPQSVLVMSALLLVFVILAGVCNLAARPRRMPDAGAE